MRRDMELVRKILEQLESDSSTFPIAIDGYESNVTFYHVRLLNDAGFVTIHEQRPLPDYTRLTWHGHDYLDELRGAD